MLGLGKSFYSDRINMQREMGQKFYPVRLPPRRGDSKASRLIYGEGMFSCRGMRCPRKVLL